MTTILGKIFEKFIIKKKKIHKRVYYHSFDIFRTVGSSSEDFDS
jgi:hypothetical protein